MTVIFGGRRIVNDVSYVTRINHESHFGVTGAVFGHVRIVNDVSYVTRINHESHSA